MKVAFLFPGQGAQYVGMGKDFFEKDPTLFQRADAFLNEEISKIILEGPEDLLTETRNSQLAIFIVSAAILDAFQKEYDITPTFTAGLSLGEYTALYASGRLSFEETLSLIQKRANFMNEACVQTKGTMAAVIGFDAAKIREIINAIEGVWVANYNTPAQTVISGTFEGVEEAMKQLKEAGAKRIIPLKVHGAFHSGLMKKAEEKLAPFVLEAPLKASSISLVMNVTGSLAKEEEIRKNLIAQVTHSVSWDASILGMQDEADLFIEIGCGKALTAMNRKMGVKNALSIETLEDLQAFEKELVEK